MPCRPIPGCLSHALPRSYLLEQCSPCLHSLIGSMSLNTWLMGHWSYLLPKSAHLPPCLLLLTAVKEGIASNPFISVALSIDATVLRRAMAALRKVWTSSPNALSCGNTTIVHHPQFLSPQHPLLRPSPHSPTSRCWKNLVCFPSSGHSPGPLYLFLPSTHLSKVAAGSAALDVWLPLHSWRGGTAAW